MQVELLCEDQGNSSGVDGRIGADFVANFSLRRLRAFLRPWAARRLLPISNRGYHHALTRADADDAGRSIALQAFLESSAVETINSSCVRPREFSPAPGLRHACGSYFPSANSQGSSAIYRGFGRIRRHPAGQYFDDRKK